MQRFNAAEQALIDVWEAHTAAEFEHKDADEAIATMSEHPGSMYRSEQAPPGGKHYASSTEKSSFRRCHPMPNSNF
jgi:hypothetical protein